ncbi:unnamed protein product [Rotaria magnacalcarata]
MMTASGLQQMVLLACSLTYRRLHSSSLRIPCRTARLEVRSEPGAIWDDLIHGREHFCLERYSGRLRLRPGHPYYYQLIALMGILDLPWVDICIMKNEEIYIERLINDENVWFTVKNQTVQRCNLRLSNHTVFAYRSTAIMLDSFDLLVSVFPF